MRVADEHNSPVRLVLAVVQGKAIEISLALQDKGLGALTMPSGHLPLLRRRKKDYDAYSRREDHLLRPDVHRLAQESYVSQIASREQRFNDELQGVLVQTAAHGIVGGPTSAELLRKCIEEINARVLIGSEQVERAARTKGIRYYGHLTVDLQQSLQTLCADVWRRVFAAFGQRASTQPSYHAVESVYRVQLEQQNHIALLKGSLDLTHYAESLRTSRTERWRKIVSAAFLAGAGVVLKTLWDSLYPLVRHLGR